MGMANPDSLIDAIVTALQSISALTSSTLLAAGPASILPYYTDVTDGTVNVEQAIIEQHPGTLIVHWLGTRTGVFAKQDAIKHDFSISCKPIGRVATLFVLIRDGLCTSSGMKFKHTQLDDSVNLPEDMQLQNSTKYLTERYGLRDFSDINFTLTERGVDD